MRMTGSTIDILLKKTFLHYCNVSFYDEVIKTGTTQRKRNIVETSYQQITVQFSLTVIMGRC